MLSRIKKTLSNRTFWYVFAITIIGAVLRLSFLNFPHGLFYDQAQNGFDALRAIAVGPKWYYSGNGGREGLMMNLTAIVFKLFGVGIWQERLPAALSGILFIPLMFLLAKKFFSTKISLFLTMLTAILPWTIMISRTGLRAALLPTVLAAAALAVIKATEDGRTRMWILAGFLIGLGFHTYKAYPIAIIPLLAIAFYPVTQGKRPTIKQFAFAVLVAGITAAPVLYTQFVTDSSVALYREKELIGWGAHNGYLHSFLISALKTVGMFSISGDENLRYNLFKVPVFEIISSFFFMFGLSQGLTKKGKILIVWLSCGLLPGILSLIEAPHFLRTSVAMIPAILLVGLGYEWFSSEERSWHTKIPLVIKVLPILSLVFTLVIIGTNVWLIKETSAYKIGYNHANDVTDWQAGQLAKKYKTPPVLFRFQVTPVDISGAGYLLSAYPKRPKVIVSPVYSKLKKGTLVYYTEDYYYTIPKTWKRVVGTPFWRVQ